MIKLKSGDGPTMRGVQLSDVGNPQIVHNYQTVLVSGGTADRQTLGDAVFDVYTEATYHRGGRVTLQGGNFQSYSLINLTPDVASIDTDRTITRLSSGVLEILMRGDLVTLKTSLDLRDKSDEIDQPKEFVNIVSGCLGEHCINQVDSRINNTMTLNENGKVFTIQDHAAQNYVRNPDLWLSQGTAIDLTCISPWNSNGGPRKAGTVISPRNLLGAAHYQFPVGTVIRCVGNDGTVYDRTVVGKATLPDVDIFTEDFTIYTVDSDFPAAIKPVEMMPSDWRDYIWYATYYHLPILGLDQEEKALIANLAENKDSRPWSGGGSYEPTDAARLIFYEDKISGDSGNPVFLIVNNQLALHTVYTMGGAGYGSVLANYLPEINQLIVDADTQAGVSGVDDPSWPSANGHYQVKEADFSAFPNYAS